MVASRAGIETRGKDPGLGGRDPGWGHGSRLGEGSRLSEQLPFLA